MSIDYFQKKENKKNKLIFLCYLRINLRIIHIKIPSNFRGYKERLYKIY